MDCVFLKKKERKNESNFSVSMHHAAGFQLLLGTTQERPETGRDEGKRHDEVCPSMMTQSLYTVSYGFITPFSIPQQKIWSSTEVWLKGLVHTRKHKWCMQKKNDTGRKQEWKEVKEREKYKHLEKPHWHGVQQSWNRLIVNKLSVLIYLFT